jgi:hypothetical protein
MLKSTLSFKEPNVKPIAETAWKAKLTRAELSDRVRLTLLAHQQACAAFANTGTVTQSTFLRDRGFGLLAAWMRVLEKLKIIPHADDRED